MLLDPSSFDLAMHGLPMRFFLLPCLLLASACAGAQPEREVSQRQAQVESGLAPTFYRAGTDVPRFPLHDRMSHHGVPGVSVAVMNDGEVEWAAGYGVHSVGSADSVTARSRFQAASISKPVASIAILRLAEAGVLDLDTDVNGQMHSWQVPLASDDGPPITLRRLLSHTAGLNVHGFPGYASTDRVPSTVGVLSGAGNTEAVRQDTVAGAHFDYSGGGYTVAQLLLEDVTGESFADVAAREVLGPLGMVHSTFAQPLPRPLAPEAAAGHRDDGTVVPGQWHTYPEMAAAGLWTTPTDLARFMLAVRAAAREGTPFLSVASAREALAPVQNGYGLGFGSGGEGDSLTFGHSGANAGYRAAAYTHLASGDGVIVMTNSDTGSALADEIARAVATVYGWPYPLSEARETVAVAPEALDRFVGRYRLDEEPDVVVTVAREDDRLRITVPTYWDVGHLLWASSPTEFFDMGDGSTVVFEGEGTDTVLVLLGAYHGRRVD